MSRPQTTVPMRWVVAAVLLPLLAAVGVALPAAAGAEQASEPGSVVAAGLDVGRNHSCAIVAGGAVRCWGYGGEGELGYGNRLTVGDDEAPGTAGPVDLGAGRTAVAVSAGDFHTCTVLDDGSVRCWGFGGLNVGGHHNPDGRLGYGDGENIGDDEAPSSWGPVDLGTGRTARAITAGGAHTCAVLDDRSVRCWGYAFFGQLGYRDPLDYIGNDETPGSVGPVNLGPGRTATAISAGDRHTCALLDGGDVRCWGRGDTGQLGYGNRSDVGDDETPEVAGPVDLGGRAATAISAGGRETCAVLDDGSVRCWGFGENGRLGYGSLDSIGDNEVPGSVGPVDLGPGDTAVAVGVGDGHACAVLKAGGVRCWGFGFYGQLGYGSRGDVGDNETPGSVGPADVGAGRALAVAVGARHTCARMDDGGVRCWGYGGNGRLGYCNERTVGDDEPLSVLPPLVALQDATCPPFRAGGSASTPGGGGPQRGGGTGADPPATAAERAQERRARGLRSCLAQAGRAAGRARRQARGGPAGRRSRARRRARRLERTRRGACLGRFGRTPGRVTGLTARAVSQTRVVLTFDAPGTDGARPPAARAYLVRQSLRPIRGPRQFERAQALCGGRCRFPTVRQVGASVTLTITDLRPHTTYHYAVAARDNVSGRPGRRSRPAAARTRGR